MEGAASRSVSVVEDLEEEELEVDEDEEEDERRPVRVSQKDMVI